MSKTTLVHSNRTSIDRSTSFFQREYKQQQQQQAAATTATTRSERGSSRPEKREEDDFPKTSRTSRTKPEGAEEKAPLICELTRQPVAPPRRKKPIPGPVIFIIPYATIVNTVPYGMVHSLWSINLTFLEKAKIE